VGDTTPAAAIFAASAIGAAAGQGRLLVALVATLLSLLVLEIRHLKVLNVLDGRRYTDKFTHDTQDPHLTVTGVQLPGGHDLHAKRHQRDRDQLEVGQPERDADDREA
jgi:uncharacterized membrane protein YhiD involved in acid resistance